SGVGAVRVPAVLLPVRAALPLLTRAWAAGDGHRSTLFWGAAAVHALHLLARGLLLPGLTADDHDAWRVVPLAGEDLDAVRGLAAAMPPKAPATAVGDAGSVRRPGPERLLRAFRDAGAASLPRPAAARLVRGTPGYGVPEPQH